MNIGLGIAYPPLNLASKSFPGIDITFPNEEWEDYINITRLETALAGTDDELFVRSRAALAGLVYVLRSYVAQGGKPLKVRWRDISGHRDGDTWQIFAASCGVVMRCNATLSNASQTFELLPAYLEKAQEILGIAPWYVGQTNCLGTTSDGTLPPVQSFWNLHVKTAEVI